jgi:hypothetical protein
MTKIEDFFAGPQDEPSNPRLRDWKRRMMNGNESATLELYRPPATLGLSRTKMFVHFAQNGTEHPPEEADWDERLNSGLIRLKVRARDLEKESERFALGLRDGFRSVEREFGNGYFNAVLLDIVTESNLDQEPEIAEVLRSTYHDQTDRSSKTYGRCRDAIELGIRARAKELTGPLGYATDEARKILAGAIAKYLDERFSVTSRRQMGLLA